MKVWIENSDKKLNMLQGKSLFCNRLARELKKKGVVITADLSIKTDISLNVIRIKHYNSKKKILRIDGVWHDTRKKFKEKNKNITESLLKADGVVFQSNFSLQMGIRYLGEPRCPVKVIHNGSDPSFYDNVMPMETGFENVVMAFSKWRPHKRLRDIIESFLLAEIKDSVLVIAGDTLRSGLSESELFYYHKNSKIIFLGNVSQNVLASYLKVAKAVIHLCWFDSCPNSVVESIVAGVPVVCNNVGGTWELVGESGGIICCIDSPYDMNPVDLYNPPEINRCLVATALKECIMANRPKLKKEHVLIENTAKQYLDFMKELL